MNRHFVLTHGRSGSNFLVNSLNQHPAIVNYGEVLGSWTVPYRLFRIFERFGWGWDRYIDWLYESPIPFSCAQFYSAISHLRKSKAINYKSRVDVKSIGIKDFAFLIDRNNLGGLFETTSNLKVIYLLRKNHFHRYVSLLGMRSSGLVSSEAPPDQEYCFDIDITDMLDKIHTYEREAAIGSALIEGMAPDKLFTLDYEDYFQDEEHTRRFHREIFHFLGVEEIDVISGQKKIITRPMHEFIRNYAAVVNALKDSGYEGFIPTDSSGSATNA